MFFFSLVFYFFFFFTLDAYKSKTGYSDEKKRDWIKNIILNIIIKFAKVLHFSDKLSVFLPSNFSSHHHDPLGAPYNTP